MELHQTKTYFVLLTMILAVFAVAPTVTAAPPQSPVDILCAQTPDYDFCAPGNQDVTICHVPPGNEGNPQTLTVSENALNGHWDNDQLHGEDTLGPCPVDQQELPTEKISPILECVVDNGDDTYTARFGYENKNTQQVMIPEGSDNKLVGSVISTDGPVTTFDYPVANHPEGRPGRTPYDEGVFTVDFSSGNIVWSLKGPDGSTRTATASTSSKACPEPRPTTVRVCKVDPQYNRIGGWDMFILPADVADENDVDHAIAYDEIETIENLDGFQTGRTNTGDEWHGCVDFEVPEGEYFAGEIVEPGYEYSHTVYWYYNDSNWEYQPNGEITAETFPTSTEFTTLVKVVNTMTPTDLRVCKTDPGYNRIGGWQVFAVPAETAERYEIPHVITEEDLENYQDIFGFVSGETNTGDEWHGCTDFNDVPETEWFVGEVGQEGWDFSHTVYWYYNDSNWEYQPNGEITTDAIPSTEEFTTLIKVVNREQEPEYGKVRVCKTNMNYERMADWDVFLLPADVAAENNVPHELTSEELEEVSQLEGFRTGTTTAENGNGCVDFDEVEVQDIFVGEVGQYGWEFNRTTYWYYDDSTWSYQPNGEITTDAIPMSSEFTTLIKVVNKKVDEPICVIDEEMITNGGFETPVVTHNKKWDIYADGTSGLGWNVERGTSASNFGGDTIPEDANLELHRGVNNWVPFEGDQYAELDADWEGPNGNTNGEPATIKIYQDMATEPGATYEVSFAFSPRPNTNAADNQLEVWIDGNLVDTITRAGVSNTDWTTHNYSFVADSTSTRIMFVEVGTENAAGTFLDDVSVVCQAERPFCGDQVVNQETEECDGDAPEGYTCNSYCELVMDEPVCEEGAEIEIVSDTSWYDGDGFASATYVHPAWDAEVFDATWIWTDEFVQDGANEQVATFTKNFTLVGSASVADMVVAADNSYEIYINGVLAGADANSDNFRQTTKDTYDVTSLLVPGHNTIEAIVTNEAGSSNPQSNPAGLRLKLEYMVTCEEEPVCGDGVVNQESEQCDMKDGVEEGYTCNDYCELERLPFCGDQVVNQETEECDGEAAEGYTCTQECKEVPNFCAHIMHQDVSPSDSTNIYTVDPTTGVGTLLISYPEKLRSVVATHADGTLYSVRRDGSNSGDLVILEPNGTITTVGDTNLQGNVVAMEFSPDGILYLMGQDTDDLFEINTATGAATKLADLTFNVQGGDLVVTSDSIIFVKNDGKVFVVDRNTYSATQVGTIPGTGFTSAAIFDGTMYAMDKDADALYSFTVNPFNYTLIGSNVGPFEFGDGTTCAVEEVKPYCGDGIVNQESEMCDGDAGVGEGQYCTQSCELYTNSGVNPIFECWEQDPENEGMYLAHFGWENHNGENVTVPHNSSYNEVVPASFESSFPEMFSYPAPNHPDGREGRTGYYPNNAITINNWNGDNIVWQLTDYGTATAGLDEKLMCPSICGDGITEGEETCDDGNLENGDGCDSYCQIEEPVCEETSFAVVSDTSWTIGEANAVETYDENAAWTADITGATWIWSDEFVQNPTQDEYALMTKEFDIDGVPGPAEVQIATDNSFVLWINGMLVLNDTDENNHALATQQTIDVTSYLQQGTNTIEVEVKNWAGNADPKVNPAGLLFRLEGRTACDDLVCEEIVVQDGGYAPEFVEATQGLQRNGNAVAAERSITSQGLVFESGRSVSHFYSLGFGGEFVAEFVPAAQNGDGDDIAVVEDTWGGPYPTETAEVYVSNDGITWTLLGEASNFAPEVDHSVSTFDLGAMPSARYIKLVDTSVLTDFNGKPGADGFDLNGFYAIHDGTEEICEYVPETNETDNETDGNETGPTPPTDNNQTNTTGNETGGNETGGDNDIVIESIQPLVRSSGLSSGHISCDAWTWLDSCQDDEQENVNVQADNDNGDGEGTEEEIPEEEEESEEEPESTPGNSLTGLATGDGLDVPLWQSLLALWIVLLAVGIGGYQYYKM